jgi:hypothetical protein
MKLSISELLQKTDNLPSKKEKIEFLRAQANKPFLEILRHFLDPSIKFLLPEKVNYRFNEFTDCDSVLYAKARELYLFVEGGHPTLTQDKRDKLWRLFLEALSPSDALLMLEIRNKKLPYKTVTEELIKEAFPGLITT